MSNQPQTLEGIPLFDYSYLPSETDLLYVKRKTKEARTLLDKLGSSVQGSEVFAIGKILLDVKRRLPKKLFLPWVSVELQHPRSIDKYLRVTRRLGNRPQLAHLSYSILYELSSSYIPDSFLDRIESGEIQIATMDDIKAFKSALRPDNDHAPTTTHSVPQDIKSELDAIQKRITVLTETHNIMERDVEAADNALQERDKELADLHNKLKTSLEEKRDILEDNERLAKEKGFLLEKYRDSNSQLNRIVILAKKFECDVVRVLNERPLELIETEMPCQIKEDDDSTTQSA